MIAKVKVTAALLTAGVFLSLGYTAIAQQNPTPDPTPTSDTFPDPAPTSDTSPDPTTTSSPSTESAPTSNPYTTLQSQSRVSASDKQFMIKAAQGGMAEVTLSKLAAQRAVTPQVKQFAQRLIQDHTNANNELMQIAAQKGVTLPKDIDAQHKAVRARLGQIPGKRLDRNYMAEMIKDHTKDVTLFQGEIQRGRDTDVKAFASKTLPIIKSHLQMARQMSANSGGTNQNASR